MGSAAQDKALFKDGYAATVDIALVPLEPGPNPGGPNPLVGSNPTQISTVQIYFKTLNMLREFIRRF
jgi:hypothetical protein